MEQIKYKKGYKYQLKESYTVTIPLRRTVAITTEYICLDTIGSLFIRKGYAWDGPSGPTIDTRTFMRGSLIHDALYQLIRGGHLPHSVYREEADRILYNVCKEDGMSRFRAWYVWKGVRWFANPASEPSARRKLIEAPKQ